MNRIAVIVIIAAAAATVCPGQWLETTIPLAIFSYPSALCHNPQNNKVYCANYLGGSVTVIDGASDLVLRTIGVGNGPIALCHNPIQNRVYVANNFGSSISVLRDSMPGVEECPQPRAPGSRLEATLVRGSLSLPRMGLGTRSGLSDNPVMSRAELLDAAGRRVMDLGPGANDVRHLSPGVYSVWERGAGSKEKPAVRKVIVTQ